MEIENEKDKLIKKLQDRIKLLEDQLPSDDEIKKEYLAMRLTEDEVHSFYLSVLGKLDEKGVWTEKVSGGRGQYPTILRRGARHSIEEVSRGEKTSNAASYTCSHIVLLANGYKPFVLGLQASHLCHLTLCCKLEHLRWETRWKNELRNACRAKQQCTCKLTPSCIFGEH